MLFLATAINYIDRQTLSILEPLLKIQLGMTSTDYSHIVNAFLASYTVMYALGGRIIDWLGTRLGMALHVLWWSIAECVHALVQTVPHLALCRSLLGVGEAGEIPGSEKVIAERFPPSERSLAMSVFLLGAMVGATVAPPLVVLITKLWGWRFAFVATGLMGFAWVMVWLVFFRLPPISRDAKAEAPDRILPNLKTPGSAAPLPWLKLFDYRATWGVMMGRFFLDATWFFYLFWLPEFLSHQKGLSLEMIGMVAWIPFLSADLEAIGGGAAATFLLKRHWTPDQAHRGLMFVGAFALFGPLALARTDGLALSLVWISLGTFAIQFVGSNIHTVPSQVFDSSSVGSVGGLAGACGSIGGMLLTHLIGCILDHYKSYELCLDLIGSVFPVMVMVSLLVMGKVGKIAPATSVQAPTVRVEADPR
ncbi:MAG TPA: MFS transporter [Terriglobia bacterium]|nr:MFS transporter [Terriglobia bacterium]